MVSLGHLLFKIMTLKEQFEEALFSADPAESCAELAEALAVNFSEWLRDNGADESFKDFSPSNFWEAFKIERDL